MKTALHRENRMSKEKYQKDQRRNGRYSRFGLIYGTVLAVFTAYTLLDTFVIPHSYASVTATASEADDESNISDSTGQSRAYRSTDESADENTDQESSDPTDSALVSNGKEIGTYSDSQVSITVTSCRVDDTTIYVADIQAEDTSLPVTELLQTAFADDSYGRNVKAATSEIASDNNAVLAINGDFYGARSDGYVIRGSVLYRDTGGGYEDLAIMEDGSFRIFSENEISAEDILAEGAVDVFSFGPGLVEDGEISVTENEEVGKAMASNPRTAIGYLGEGHYVLVVSDGRTQESQGLTLYQLAEFMQGLGCETAYNLDGGGSSTMFFNGSVINKPTTSGNRIKERSVSDIIYVG